MNIKTRTNAIVFSCICGLVVLLLSSQLHAQKAVKRYEIGSKQQISAKVQTLEIIYLQAEMEGEVLEVTVYPNPTTAQLNINVGQNRSIDQVNIISMRGDQITAPEIESSDFRSKYDVSNLPAGVYLLNIQLDNGEWISRKIIKTNRKK